MDLRDTPEEAAFRGEVQAWLDANLTDDLRAGRYGDRRFEDAARLRDRIAAHMLPGKGTYCAAIVFG